jgi:acetylserotonin O-methyltransferase
MSQDVNPPDPSIVLDLFEAFRRSKTMFAAVSLGVFDALSSGPSSPEDLAQRLGANADALRRLLDACVGLQLLERQDGLYRNTPVASTYLTANGPRRLTGYVRFSNDALWRLWANLEDAVRKGTHRWAQTFGGDGPIFSHIFRDEAAKREFLMGMHGYGGVSSPAVVAAFDLSRFRRLVDLGGASGHLAIAACERYSSLRAVVLDLPEAVPLAHEIVGASSVADRIDVEAGDFFRDPLPEGDLYSLGRILHDWTEAKILGLLTKIHERLPAGGGLLIAEILLDPDKGGPLRALMFDLNMLVVTEGKERTLREYEGLLKRVGFDEIHGHRTNAPVDAIFALKPRG